MQLNYLLFLCTNQLLVVPGDMNDGNDDHWEAPGGGDDNGENSGAGGGDGGNGNNDNDEDENEGEDNEEEEEEPTPPSTSSSSNRYVLNITRNYIVYFSIVL